MTARHGKDVRRLLSDVELRDIRARENREGNPYSDRDMLLDHIELLADKATAGRTGGAAVDQAIADAERLIARVATGGTIVCSLCNASDVTDDDHRAGCPVHDLRAALRVLADAVEKQDARVTELEAALRRADDYCARPSGVCFDRVLLAVARPREQQEPRDGIVTVRDSRGQYLGCMGQDTWRVLIQHPPIHADELERLIEASDARPREDGA